MKTVLFVTHKAARCGIAQYGVDTVEQLKKSTKYKVIHVKVENKEELDSVMVQDGKLVDAMIWNYPVQLRAWVDENNPNKHNYIPTALINHDSSTQSGIDGSYRSPYFSDFIYFNPFLTSTKSFVHVIPRLIKKCSIHSPETPRRMSVGTFGFATTVKKLKMLCDVLKENFEEGVDVMVHIPPNDVVDPTGYSSNQFMDIIREGLPNTFGVVRSSVYKTTEEMIQWLSENDLNVFFYEAGQLGLSSSLDYAIAAGKPIAVNDVPAFAYLKNRHPSPFIEDYPQGAALKEIIKNGDTFSDLRESSEEKFLLAWEQALDKMTGRQ